MSFSFYPGNEAWAEALYYATMPVEPAVALLKANHRYAAELLKLCPDPWERNVVFPGEPGEADRPITVHRIVVMQVEHIAEHVAEIQAIRAKHNL
jgi:hypothetical protein